MIRRNDREEREESRLLTLYHSMNAQGREQLIDFGEFLVDRHPAPDRDGGEQPLEPLPIERPQEESVIKSIQRLSKSYPMLDKAAMLHSTSALLSQHVMQGRAAVEVIDDLELLFRRHYEEWRVKLEEGQ